MRNTRIKKAPTAGALAGRPAVDQHAGSTPMSGRRKPRGSSGALIVAGVLLLVAAAALGWLALTRHSSAVPDGSAGVDMNGNPVLLDPGEELTDEQRRQQEARPDGNGRFIVSSVGLDVDLGSMREVDGVVTPPGFASAYWITNRGAGPNSPAAGTVYVAMHALRGGGLGPGNYLYDADTGATKVPVGATITVGGLDYAVDSSATIDKADLPSDSELWNDVPDRLVVITCLQKSDDTPAVANFVIIAHRST